MPYEDDGRDADTVISWIARQPWSNGNVGMFGGSYNGLTQWAAAKFGNPHLETIVPWVPNNPANGLPMQNNIFQLVNCRTKVAELVQAYLEVEVDELLGRLRYERSDGRSIGFRDGHDPE